jgi:hypothetical protein
MATGPATHAPSPAPPPPWRAALLIAVLTLATFSAAMRNQFILDDLRFVVNNPVFQSLRGVPLIFGSDDAVGTPDHNPYYRPLTTLTFCLDRLLHGSDPLGYHATNLLLHLAVSVLLLLAALKLTARPHAAFLATLLFAIHPAHAEPVAYISARADLMCGLGLTASLLAHLRWRETGSRAALLLSTALFGFALFSKIVAIVFPALLVVHAFCFARGEARRRAAAILPYVAVAILFLVVRNNVLVVKVWDDSGPAPFEVRLANSGVFLVKYLRNAIFPFGLRLFYDYPIRASLGEPIVLSAWSTLAAVALLSAANSRRHPALLFGAAWFFACLLPVSGIIMIFYPAVMADRYMYVPLIGLAFASLPILERIPGKAIRLRARPALACIVLVVAAGMVATTASRVTAWHDPIRYWKLAAADNPGSIHVLAELGSAYMEAERLDEAERVLARAVTIWDNRADTRIRLAVIGMKRGDFAGAERQLFRALEIQPGDSGALSLLAEVFARTGRDAEARQFREEAARRGAPP